ncbi:dihydroneopterin aldolase [Caldimonas tepidiphila]|uniref:dihydroneopterin aldolase n=1 Tax=Caldimonas tepidiphila TaxID=2315841 RepID=UPI00147558AF|nr:dihydroneopterin aldolase [Caldimonas tepidiphila]
MLPAFRFQPPATPADKGTRSSQVLGLQRPAKPDLLLIRKLALPARIGVYDWEQEAPQPIVLDLCFEPPASPASVTDRLEDTVDYAQVVARLREIALAEPKQLVEAMAHRMAEVLMEEFDARWVSLELVKTAPIPGSEVGIRIERQR